MGSHRLEIRSWVCTGPNIFFAEHELKPFLWRHSGLMRGVMPTSPWVLTIAGLMWIALVAAAAWVGSNTGVLPDVLSTVLGTAVGLAFAATGLAVYGDQRRKRRQRKTSST